MFTRKAKAPSPDQRPRLDNALRKLKSRLAAFPRVSNAHTEDKRVLERRKVLRAMKSASEEVGPCIMDAMDIWPDGKQPLSELLDGTKLMAKIVQNLLEENLLWDRPEPMDDFSMNRRRQIFAENRTLSRDGDTKFAAASAEISALTGFRLVD